MSHIAWTKEDIIDKTHRDREELFEKVFEIYPRLKGRYPAELVADIIFDVCDWGVAPYSLNPKQFAYCDFSSKRIFVNSKLSQMAKKLKVDPVRLQRTTLGHELGHIRLHAQEMENRDFRSYLEPSMGYDDTRADQRENEAELYAAVFLVPWKMLPEHAVILQDAVQTYSSLDRKELKGLNESLDAFNLQMAERFSVTPNLMSRSLQAYGLIDRRPTKNPDAFKLCLRRRTSRESY